MRGIASRGWLAKALVAIAATATMVLAGCAAPDPVVVTVTTRAGGTQVTAPTMPPASEGASSPTQAPEETAPASPDFRITANPVFGTDVGPRQEISLTAFNGTIDHVTLVGDNGTVVEGEISADGHTWTKTDTLEYGVSYRVEGKARAADGTEQPIEGSYTAVDPKKTLLAQINTPDGATLGVATPIIITFSDSVTNRAAVERALKVTVNGGDDIEGSWGWMQDEDIQGTGVKQSRVHFRTEKFWPAHTDVHLEANLYGVDLGGGFWGRADLQRDFSIGENLQVHADVESHRLRVTVDDSIIRDYPVSYGVPASKDPGKTTVSGIHIVQGFEGDPETGEFEMCNPKYNYCNSKQYWGVRINNNGEFIHVNKKTEESGLLGKANVSHGCVNMSMKDGKEFYDMVYYGVPVIVENTGVEMGYSDYVWDWSVSYAQWKTFSAL